MLSQVSTIHVLAITKKPWKGLFIRVVDTGDGLSPASLTPVINIHSWISPRIFEKILKGPMEYLGARGTMIHENKPEVENLVSNSIRLNAHCCTSFYRHRKCTSIYHDFCFFSFLVSKTDTNFPTIQLQKVWPRKDRPQKVWRQKSRPRKILWQKNTETEEKRTENRETKDQKSGKGQQNRGKWDSW